MGPIYVFFVMYFCEKPSFIFCSRISREETEKSELPVSGGIRVSVHGGCEQDSGPKVAKETRKTGLRVRESVSSALRSLLFEGHFFLPLAYVVCRKVMC